MLKIISPPLTENKREQSYPEFKSKKRKCTSEGEGKKEKKKGDKLRSSRLKMLMQSIH